MRSGDYRYKIENGEAVLLEYVPEDPDAPGGVIRIPETLGGFPVRRIATGAFEKNGMMIERIELPRQVRVIEDLAFRNCVSLTELKLNEGLEVIGANCLYITAADNIFIPSSVHTIRAPYDLGEFSWEAAEDNPWYESDGFGLYKKDSITGEKVLAAVQKNRQLEEYEVLPGTVKIGNNSFEGQMHIKKVVIPEGVTQIGSEAFVSCQELREISLPSTLKRIEDGAFRCCVRLESIRLPGALEYIGDRAITDTYGWSDRLNGIRYIEAEEGEGRFFSDENALFEKTDNGIDLIKYFGTSQEYRIPEFVRRIGDASFRRANAHRLILPETLLETGESAFKECAHLESIYFENDNTEIYIPRTPVYRKDEISGLFYTENGRLRYDYHSYDRLLKDWSQLTVRCRMAAFRLEYPKELSEDDGRQYKDLILDNLEEILKDIAKREDIEDLKALTRSGVLDREISEIAAETLGRLGIPKLTGFIMEYKQETFGIWEDDFSL